MGSSYKYTDPNPRYYYALNDPEKRRFPYTPQGYKLAAEYEAQLAAKEFRAAPRPETGEEGDVVGPLPDPKTFAKSFAPGTPWGQTETGEAIRTGQAFEGIESAVDDDKDKTMIKALVDAGRFDDVVKYVQNIKAQGVQRYSGGRGSEIKYTQDNPEKVKEFQDMVQEAIDSGVLRDEDVYTLKGHQNAAIGNLFEAQRGYNNVMGRITSRLAIIEKGIPLKAEEAEETTKARTGAKIEKEHELKDVSASTEATKQYAKTQAATRSKRAAEYALSADGMYDLTGTEAAALARSGNAIQAMGWMADQIEAGNVDWVDITEAGKYKNPEAFMNNKIIGEYYARPLSGAAINEGEWKTFRKEVLTVAYLQTEEGKKAAVSRLHDLQRNRIADGTFATKDKNWYDKYQKFEAPKKKKKGKQKETDIESLRSKYKY